ncbi:hypothetical protein MHBO_001291 [Bonamia ostreae]|uniref:WW domain-containing protein n=1 Tax=Bonamia ostreae TaxID=126728 RepID=A0ABV2AIE7_9EUKA
MKKFGRWRGALDKESGRIYYYHTFSNKVTWVKPKEMVEQENRRKAQKMKKYLKKKNKNKNEVNEKVIEAFQSTGLRFFMDSAAISVIDFCLDRKDFNGAKDAVIR